MSVETPSGGEDVSGRPFGDAGTAEPLSRENALVLVDEFEALFARDHGEHTDPRARESAKRILSSLTMAPGPRHEIETRLQRILGWTEVLFTDSGEAGPGSIKISLRRNLAELRALIELGETP